MSYVKIGVAGPVGSGKTALIESLTRKMAGDYSIGVITNDIYTKEDAEFLCKNSIMPKERILGVETGGCPHTAIREDASMNLEAVDELLEQFPTFRLFLLKAAGITCPPPSAPNLPMPLFLLLMWRKATRFPEKEVRALPVRTCSLSIKSIWPKW